MSEVYNQDWGLKYVGKLFRRYGISITRKDCFLCLFTVNWLVEPLITVVNGKNENIRSPVRDDMFFLCEY